MPCIGLASHQGSTYYGVFLLFLLAIILSEPGVTGNKYCMDGFNSRNEQSNEVPQCWRGRGCSVNPVLDRGPQVYSMKRRNKPCPGRQYVLKHLSWLIWKAGILLRLPGEKERVHHAGTYSPLAHLADPIFSNPDRSLGWLRLPLLGMTKAVILKKSEKNEDAYLALEDTFSVFWLNSSLYSVDVATLHSNGQWYFLFFINWIHTYTYYTHTHACVSVYSLNLKTIKQWGIRGT